MAGPSRIGDILNHLAWLREQLGTAGNQGNAYAGALLTYNAAAALQWHFVLPSSSFEEIASAADRSKAAKLIDTFVWRVRELFANAKQTSKKALAGKTGKTLIGELRAAIAAVLRRLPKLMQLPTAEPRHLRDLLRSLDPARMLREWLGRRGLTEKVNNPALKKATSAGPRSGLRSTLAAASVLADASVYGPRGKDYRQGSSEVISAMLGHAVSDYAATLDKKSAKRIEALVQDIISGFETL